MPKDITLFNVTSSGGNTHSNKDRKLLQAFLAKLFLIDRHAKFTEVLSSSCVAVACLPPRFLSVRSHVEVEKSNSRRGPKSLG